MYNSESVIVSRKILDNSSLNGHEKLALIVLSDTSSISYDNLAKKIGVTKPTAISVVKKLEGKGLLKCIPKYSKENIERSNTNRYFVII